MIEKGIFPFIATQPLTREGSFLRVHPRIDDSDAATFVGKMVFIPHGSVFLFPGTLAHGGGYRTGPRGNLRMHYVFFLISEGVSRRDQQELIPATFTQTYFGMPGTEIAHRFQIKNAVGINGDGLYNCSELTELTHLIGF